MFWSTYYSYYEKQWLIFEFLVPCVCICKRLGRDDNWTTYYIASYYWLIKEKKSRLYFSPELEILGRPVWQMFPNIVELPVNCSSAGQKRGIIFELFWVSLQITGTKKESKNLSNNNATCKHPWPSLTSNSSSFTKRWSIFPPLLDISMTILAQHYQYVHWLR